MLPFSLENSLTPRDKGDKRDRQTRFVLCGLQPGTHVPTQWNITTGLHETAGRAWLPQSHFPGSLLELELWDAH